MVTLLQTWVGSTAPAPRGKNPMFAHELWNCYQLTVDGAPRTTNSLEAWHNSLKRSFGNQFGKRPKFWKWLREMKTECAEMERRLLSPEKPRLNASDERLSKQRTVQAKGYNRDKLLDYITGQANLVNL